MAVAPTIFVVCSDCNRNGKTLLARVLIDHLLLEERDPFCFDLSAPEGGLRAYFPGRTALIDFNQESGRNRLFDTILSQSGRHYVLDVPAVHMAAFCEAASSRDFMSKAEAAGYRMCVIYIVDREEKSLQTALAVEEVLLPDLFVPAVNRFVGSCLPENVPGPLLILEKIDPDLQPLVSNRRFSLRSFMLGEETTIPARLRPNLKNFLHGLVRGMRDFEPALSLQALKAAEG